MDSHLEDIGVGIIIIATFLIAINVHIELLPISCVLGFLMICPLLFILSKTKYGYKHKWVIILLCLFIIAAHLVLITFI